MIDLKQFCGKNDIRYYLNIPFSEGEFTYATNGHILVRVPRREDVPEVDEKSTMRNKIPKMFADNPFVVAVPIPDVPAQVEQDCDCCNGGGVHERKCGASEDYDCEECGASGRVMAEPGELRYPQIEVGDTYFSPTYLRMVKALPNAQLSPNGQTPAPFTFDGGDGLLMPMRKAP